MSCKAFLSPLNFKFQIKKLPVFSAYVQTVDFPAITTGRTEGQPNPFQHAALPGLSTTFDTLSVSFKIDEDMDNYLEIFDWITGLGSTLNFDQYAAMADAPFGSGDGTQVDATLTVSNSNNVPNIEFHFYDLYPFNLSGFKLDYTAEDVQYLTATVDFAYTQYVYKRL